MPKLPDKPCIACLGKRVNVLGDPCLHCFRAGRISANTILDRVQSPPPKDVEPVKLMTARKRISL